MTGFAVKKVPKNSPLAAVRHTRVNAPHSDYTQHFHSADKAKYHIKGDNGIYLLSEHYGDSAITINWSFFPGRKSIKTIKPEEIRLDKYNFATASNYKHHADGKHLTVTLNDLFPEEGFHLIKNQVDSEAKEFEGVVSNFMKYTKELFGLSNVTRLNDFSYCEGKEQTKFKNMVYAAEAA